MKLFLILLFSIFSLLGFSQQYNFRRYDVKAGLSQNTVWCEFQDSKGFIWFGTKDGLNRFDGRDFKVFRKKNGDSTSLGNNFIHSIWEDEKQHLWIGTEKGIYIYDPLKESFHPFNKKTKNNVLISGIVNTITKDKSGNIWIAAFFNGVFKYNTYTDKLMFYNHDPNNNQSLSSNLAWTVYCDSKGEIWVGTHMGGLCHYNPHNDSFIKYIPEKSSVSLNDDNIYSIYEDSQSNFWIGTAKGGLNLMDRQTGTFEHYPIGNKKNELSNSKVLSIIEIFPGKLFIGTENGLNDFELKTQIFNTYYYSFTNSKSISDNAIYSLYKDKENNIWIGTYFGGVNCLSFNCKPFEHYYTTNNNDQLIGKAVSVFCEDKKNNLWVGTEDGGLNYFNTLTKNFNHFLLPEKANNIHALLIDGDNLWVGNFETGILKINQKTKKIKHYTFNPSDSNSLGFSCVFSLYKDKTENIWVGGIFGLCKYNRAKDNFTRIKNFGLDHIYIYNILQDNIGNIWFASYNDGIFRFNPKTNKWKNYRHQPLDRTTPGNDKIISIYQDQQNRLWFGTEGAGLCQYIYEKDCFKIFDEENNLPNNVVYSILDDGPNLWISSNNGLTRFNPETSEAHTYNESDGLQSNQFNYQSGYKAHDGKMYFGGINGFNAFYPHLLKDNEYIPPVVITDFQILNKKVPVGIGSPLQKSITYSDEITLSYNQSVFSLEFVALSYLAPENNQYAFQLEGIDKNWNYTHERKLIYAGLPPGTYTLKIKASNNDGQWNNEGTSLRITVLPPFWKSNIALFLYVIIIILLFSAGGYNLNKRYKNRNKKRIEKLHLEKEKELNRMKIDFFTNIAHEIRSPLTLITGPLDHLIASGKGTSEIKDDYRIMKKNVQRLITLVNQLLDFRKIESNHYIIRFSKTDIVLFTKNIYEQFIHLAKEKNIEFIFNAFPENYETIIPTEALTSIIGNLLSNAFKFTNNKIELSLKTVNENYIITVTDNGSGIQPGESEKIFLPFYQEAGKKNTQKYIDGTGIGLAYVKSLVDLIEGEIMIDKEYSNGAKFIVKIPLKDCSNIKLDIYDQNNSSAIINKIKGDINLQTPVNSTEEKEPAIQELTEKSAILIVEDQEEMLHFIARLFKHNYSVFKAKNGLEALKVIEEEEIDLVISDIMMPGMDGLELCSKLKSEFETCHIPVILLTAKNTNESKIEGLKQGADAYIEKPFEYEHLLIQVNNLLDNRRKLKLHFIKEPFVKTNEIVSSQHDEQFVLTIENLITDKLPDPDFSIDELASEMHISRSGFHKKLKGITGLTPNDFIKLIRMKKAAELLTNTDYRINEICYMTGFNSPSYFAKCFQEQFGVLPTDFQKKSKSGK